jgi:hypothetical protein
MVLKTFNVEKVVYDDFSSFCKSHGINMSKQIEIFMQFVIEDEPRVKQEYLKKLERIKKGSFIRVDDFAKMYGS